MEQGMQQDGQLTGDEGLFVKFYMGTQKDEERSNEAGHPVFNDVPFVKIMVPGDKNTVIDTVADKQYQHRFARLWKQFTSQETQTHTGMPLKEWPAVTRGQVEELNYLNIHTVEQLASCADSHGQKVMNFHGLKAKAVAYLESAKDVALVQKLTETNATLQAQIDTMKAQMDEYARAFAQMQAQQGQPNVEQHRPVSSASSRK